jgi:hypothetical protein
LAGFFGHCGLDDEGRSVEVKQSRGNFYGIGKTWPILPAPPAAQPLPPASHQDLKNENRTLLASARQHLRNEAPQER